MSAITPAEYVAKIEQATESLAAPTVAKLRQAYDVWRGGALNTADLAAVLSSVLLLANAHARSVGDLMAAAGVGLLGGVAEPRPLGGSPHLDYDAEVSRLSAAAATLVGALDEPDADLTGQLSRIGHAEPAQVMRNQMRATYEGNGATGWYRGLNADACRLCQSWAGAGTFPASAEMLHHPGCGCVPIPTTERTS